MVPPPPDWLPLARALVASPRWEWRAPALAWVDGGRVVEVRGGAMGQSGAVPHLPSAGTAACLLQLLDEACAREVHWAVERINGAYAVALSTTTHRRVWTGSPLGVALAAALLARWAAIDRAAVLPPTPPGRPSAR